MRNFWAAFADAAILFPLLAALSVRSEFSGTMLLASAGVAYWAAGLIFRVPMSVQPLKSIAIAAIAIGASAAEVRLSGAILGVVCLILCSLNVNAMAKRVPPSLVHVLQLGLGILLICQGLKQDASLAAILFAAVMLALGYLTQFPALGLVATGGLIWTIASGWIAPVSLTSKLLHGSSLAAPVSNSGLILRPDILCALILPQIALTLANSVIGTNDAAKRYFGEKASRVTLTRLLASIGIGNIISASIGGLPYCHGSGGLTAHVKGGANRWTMNTIIGSTLLLLAFVQWLGGSVSLKMPPIFLSALLMTTGVFHLGLARPTWASSQGKLKLLAAAVAILVSRNMLWVLAAGIAMEIATRRFGSSRELDATLIEPVKPSEETVG